MVQNQTVLEALREARMRFERMGMGKGVMADVGDRACVESQGASGPESGERGGDGRRVDADVDVNVTESKAEIGEADEDISWAYEYRGPSSTVSRLLALILPNSTQHSVYRTPPLPQQTRFQLQHEPKTHYRILPGP